MCDAWESVWSLGQWQCHQTLCQVLYDHQHGAKIGIPPCPEDTHPLQIFEETHVDRNLYRWVVFVIWLKAHPEAWRWYRIIQKAHPHTVPTIPTLWDECRKVWPLEENSTLGLVVLRVEENQTPCLVNEEEEKQCLTTMVKPLPRS